MEAGQPQLGPSSALSLGEEVPGAFPLDLRLPRAAPPPGAEGEAAGGPAGRDTSGFLFPAEKLAKGYELLQAACLTQFATSLSLIHI